MVYRLEKRLQEVWTSAVSLGGPPLFLWRDLERQPHCSFDTPSFVHIQSGWDWHQAGYSGCREVQLSKLLPRRLIRRCWN